MDFEINLTYDIENENHDFLRMSIDRLIRYGWGGCALTVSVSTMKKIPPPPDPIPLSDRAKAILERKYGMYVLSDHPVFPQYTRLNLVTGEIQEVHQLTRHLPVLSYDIVSITPLSDSVFKSACSNLDVDLISIDVSKYQPKSCWKDLKAAMNREVAIELLYSRILSTDSMAKNMISSCDSIGHATKGRKSKDRIFVLSCGSDDPDMIRSPADVRNLGNILNIRKYDLLTSHMAKAVVAKGLARRTNAGVVRKLKELPIEKPSSSDEEFEIVVKTDPA